MYNLNIVDANQPVFIILLTRRNTKEVVGQKEDLP
jgi:hypothetical protein